MRRFTSALRTTALLGVLAVVGCAEGTPGESRLGPHDGADLPSVEPERVAVGEVAPDFTLRSHRGGTLTLSEFRGKRDIILVFYRGHW